MLEKIKTRSPILQGKKKCFQKSKDFAFIKRCNSAGKFEEQCAASVKKKIN